MKTHQVRVKEAAARTEARAKRTPHEQLAILDKSRGNAAKERKRLLAQIANSEKRIETRTASMMAPEETKLHKTNKKFTRL